MAEVDSLISSSSYELSLTSLWFHIHKCHSELSAWFSPSDPYIHWLNRVANEKEEEWKQMEIYDIILLSKKEVSLNFGLLYGFLSFWNTSVNAFNLPFNMMSPTLHDMVAIVGLPMDGDEVPFLHDALNTDLGF